ncbi:MAG: restriction endonuclease [Terriglobia bacterium]
MAEQFTAQVQEELVALGSILRYGILATYSVRPPAPPKPEDVPPEPQRVSYLPRLHVADYLIARSRKRKQAEAAGRFAGAHAEWERLASAVMARNREQAESYQADLTKGEAQMADYRRGDPATVAAYCRLLLGASSYPYLAASVPEITMDFLLSLSVATERPDAFAKSFELDYVPGNRTLVVDYELPRREAIPSVKGYRYVAAEDKIIPVPAVRTSMEETYESVLYQVALRTIYELFRWDEAGALDAVVFNGWTASIDKATGQSVHPCVLTIQATKSEFLEINLAEVDPKACFRKLKGISGARLAAMSPVRPILKMNREDKRFITARPVMNALDNSTNLAAMDWEDFEQLIRDVFENEFSGDGGEVKITRASRDHGVDAVAFDPDPIRGGKIVIQAKRYTDTVSVSAVRDLYGTILNEGANKGILVTTADYGPDAYEFAKGKPITLLNGSELLYLLQKHGHKARIDLAEARMLAADKGKGKTRTPM